MATREIYNEVEAKMKKTIEALRKDLATVRTGRATPALLDKIVVEYYGSVTPLNQLANISAPEPRMLVIQPWDKNSFNDIEKAIQKSDLGLNPNNDGSLIRLSIPPLTQQRRTELVKVVGKKAEEGRVAIRNLRRDANDQLKKLEKEKAISEDESQKVHDDVQKLTDKYIKEVDSIVNSKEKEIMEV